MRVFSTFQVAMDDAPDASMDAIQQCLMFEDHDETAKQGRVMAEWPSGYSSRRLAKLIDNSENWTDRSTTVVQVGSVLDRGGDDKRTKLAVKSSP